jgi:RNA polymerase sigma-70 factor (ECF subfamily)
MPNASFDSMLATDSDDPQTLVLIGERDLKLHQNLDLLPDLYRSVLHLHYWMGYSVEEIARQLGAPEGTVKSYLHRARMLLAHRLKDKAATNE